MNDRLRAVLSQIGANVRDCRQKRGLTQGQLATAIGVELRTVQRIEAGATNLAMGVLVETAHVLGVKPIVLMKEAEVPEVKRGRPKKAGPA